MDILSFLCILVSICVCCQHESDPYGTVQGCDSSLCLSMTHDLGEARYGEGVQHGLCCLVGFDNVYSSRCRGCGGDGENCLLSP